LAAGGLLLAATPGRAEMPSSAERGQVSVNDQEVLHALQEAWEEVREDLVRCALESAMTAFFIRGGTPPKTPPDVQPSQSPPAQEPHLPPPPEPPPPTGQGEVPPIDPPVMPPPPNGTPEPASIVSALLGIGLTSWYTWRRRRRTRAD